MDNQTLPLPNPGDWCSIAGAARLIKVSHRTIERWIFAGILTGYLPYGAPDRVASRMLWMPEVKELAAARARTRARTGADA